MKILISELENDALTPSKNGQADNAGSDDGVGYFLFAYCRSIL